MTMKRNTFIVVILTGLLYFLPASFAHSYTLVENAMTWTEAQSYCRQHYKDLATVSSEEQSNELVMAAQEYYNDRVWIGLYDDVNSWRWSLQKEGFYVEGDSEFYEWKSGEPNNFMGMEDCVVMMTNGWNDCDCLIKYPFVCYNVSGETVESSSYVFVTELKTWNESQSYCRQFYTDLVSVRNQSEYAVIMGLIFNQSAWIGLRRDSWTWSDGSPASFTEWIPPSNSEIVYINTPCVVLNQGKWEAQTCADKFIFACYLEISQQIVRVKITKDKASMNLDDASEHMILQFSQILKSKGLNRTKLTWRKQLDGNIFYSDQIIEKKEPEIICSFN